MKMSQCSESYSQDAFAPKEWLKFWILHILNDYFIFEIYHFECELCSSKPEIYFSIISIAISIGILWNYGYAYVYSILPMLVLVWFTAP